MTYRLSGSEFKVLRLGRMVKAPNISPIGLVGLKLGGEEAGKPESQEAGRLEG